MSVVWENELVDWQSVVTAGVTGLVALLGVRYGALLTYRREHQAWLRTKRYEAYVELLAAVDQYVLKYGLIAYTLGSIDGPKELSSSNVRDAIETWEQCKERLDEAIPPVKLLGSKAIQQEISDNDLFGILEVQRSMVQMVHWGVYKEVDWDRTTTKSSAKAEQIHKLFRDDLSQSDRKHD